MGKFLWHRGGELVTIIHPLPPAYTPSPQDEHSRSDGVPVAFRHTMCVFCEFAPKNLRSMSEMSCESSSFEFRW